MYFLFGYELRREIQIDLMVARFAGEESAVECGERVIRYDVGENLEAFAAAGLDESAAEERVHQVSGLEGTHLRSQPSRVGARFERAERDAPSAEMAAHTRRRINNTHPLGTKMSRVVSESAEPR